MLQFSNISWSFMICARSTEEIAINNNINYGEEQSLEHTMSSADKEENVTYDIPAQRILYMDAPISRILVSHPYLSNADRSY